MATKKLDPQGGALRYAAFDRSDPFTLARCQAHIRVGICSGYGNDANPNHYDADPASEKRSYVFDGRTVEYSATVYRNVVRP